MSYERYTRDELVTALDQLHGIHNAVGHQMLLITAELERRGAHTEDGQRTIGSWLQLHLGVNRRTAQRWSETASRIEDLPHLAETFSAGRISFDKLSACISHATPETDAATAAEAEKLDAALCERVARQRREISHTDEEKAVATKRLTFSWADMGTRLDFGGSLPAEDGVRFIAAIERIADSLPIRDGEGEIWPRANRQADALVMLASAHIATDQDPDLATVSVHVPIDTLMSCDGVGESESGGIFSSGVMHRLLCDSRVEAVIENARAEAVAVSAVGRTVPAHVRRQLKHRDGMCRFPGCSNDAFLDAHHIEWWSRGGKTNTKNLALLCRWHHRLVHEKNWTIEGDPDGEMTFVRPDGTVLAEGPEPLASEAQEWLRNQLPNQQEQDIAASRGPPVPV